MALITLPVQMLNIMRAREAGSDVELESPMLGFEVSDELAGNLTLGAIKQELREGESALSEVAHEMGAALGAGLGAAVGEAEAGLEAVEEKVLEGAKQALKGDAHAAAALNASAGVRAVEFGDDGDEVPHYLRRF